MGKRLSYEEVVNYVEKLEYILISDYKGVHEKIILKDKLGYFYEITIAGLRQGHKPEKFSKSNSFSLDNIKLFLILNKIDLEYVSGEYINYHSYLTFRDKEGYYYYNKFQIIIKYEEKSKFEKSNPYVLRNIDLWCTINKKPFRLISTEYKGANNKNLKWKCLLENCGEEFDQSWSHIQNNVGCNYCKGFKVGLSNCLATKNPELAKEWHPTKNGDLTPYDVTDASNKDIWWQCSKNPKHYWITKVKYRKDGDGCPYCSGRYPTEENNLLNDNHSLCEEWNYKKNDKFPNEYTPKSNQLVWWKCKECGHEWEARINSRNGIHKSCCPECRKSKGEKECNRIFDLRNIYYTPQKTFGDLVGVRNGSLSYDFYLSEYNLLIEYQGEMHERFVKGIHKSKKDFDKQLEHDRRKKEYALNNGYNFLEIWYWDYDNIEEILDNYFKVFIHSNML